MRRCLPHLVFAAAMSLPLTALADPPSGNCPPGAWFCADAEVQVPAPPVVKVTPPSVVVEDETPPPVVAPPPVVVRRPAPPPPVVVEEAPPPAPRAQPPVVIYQPVPAAPPTRVIIVTRGYGYPSYRQVYRPAAPPPPPPVAPVRNKWHSEWGLNLRVEGVALGKGAAEGAGMGGFGFSLRYRPVPAFAFDVGADILAGTDYNGFDRTETPISLNGMIFVNPKSRVQLYLIGGMMYSHAKVKSDDRSPLLTRNSEGENTASYSYFGGQGGAGLEFRLSRHLALDVDGLGFVRHRTDDGQLPEFIDAKTGQTTKTSGGGVFRGGLSFWW